jgi:hypothetical protein
MKAVSVKELKEELSLHSSKELLEICLRLARFKKENKELLTYILFESSDEISYVESIKEEIDQQFKHINKKSYYFIRKSVRKILLNIRKYARYSQKKETEIELLIYFCGKLNKFTPSIQKNTRLRNFYNKQIERIRKKVSFLHEDLQYDYGIELNVLNK